MLSLLYPCNEKASPAQVNWAKGEALLVGCAEGSGRAQFAWKACVCVCVYSSWIATLLALGRVTHGGKVEGEVSDKLRSKDLNGGSGGG